MPNYCYNRVTASEKLLGELYNGKEVTFQKLMPMPKEIEETEASTTTDLTRNLYDYFNGKPDAFVHHWENNLEIRRKYVVIQKYTEMLLSKYPMEELKKQHQLIEKYGVDNWYDWSIKNWGTKWDAMDTEGTPKDGCLVFYTAWNPPDNFIKKLFEKYPNEKIEWEYREEGMCFEGKFCLDGNGNVTHEEHDIYPEENEDEEEEE